MILSEIFHSIQGEGMNAGKPATFVRFGNCNLKCKWCDSKYTWHPALNDNRETPMEEVFKRIRLLPDSKHLVLTGGEPLLQQEAIKAIRREFPNYYIEVETNGSQQVDCYDEIDLFTVSYKTTNSGNPPYEIKTINDKCVYKFVVMGGNDFEEIENLIAKYNLPVNKIFLMPEGVSGCSLLEKEEMVKDLCKRRGYRFTTRMHILKWGNVRGK